MIGKLLENAFKNSIIPLESLQRVRINDNLLTVVETLSPSPNPLVVEDENGKIVGLLTAHEIVSGLKMQAQIICKDIINTEFTFIDSSLVKALEKLFTSNQSFMRVLDKNMQCVGVAGGRELCKELYRQKGKLEQNYMLMQDNIKKIEDQISFFAHDLRSPLAIGLMSCELLERKENVSEVGKQLIERLKLSNKRALNLLATMLENARRNHLKADELFLESVDLRKFVYDLVQEIRFLNADSQAKIRVLTCPKVPIKIDVQKIQRVLFNLIENAIKHGNKNATILVFAEIINEGDEVKISVRDEGPGLHQENISGIFEKFSQLKPSQSDGGVGLGLSIAKTLVEMHSGELSVAKRDDGLEFSFTLPAIEASLQPAATAKRRTINNPKILVVDDDEDFLKYFSEQLRASGYTIFSAENGQRAVKIIESEKPDLIVSDIKMPVMDGFDLWEEVNSREEGYPFIFISGYCRGLSPNQKAILNLTPWVFEKPVDKSVIVSAIKTYLE